MRRDSLIICFGGFNNFNFSHPLVGQRLARWGVLIPKGCSTIAQRFNVGYAGLGDSSVRKGRLRTVCLFNDRAIPISAPCCLQSSSEAATFPIDEHEGTGYLGRNPGAAVAGTSSGVPGTATLGES